LGRRTGILLFVLLGIVVVLGAAAAGAASAPPPAPEPVIAAVEPEAEAASPTGVPRRAALGHVVGIRGRFLAVKVPTQEKPVVVAVRPATNLRINRHPAKLEELQIGDYVVVAGRTGPRGNLIARALNVVRRP
jgi:hypothetical protein